MLHKTDFVWRSVWPRAEDAGSLSLRCNPLLATRVYPLIADDHSVTRPVRYSAVQDARMRFFPTPSYTQFLEHAHGCRNGRQLKRILAGESPGGISPPGAPRTVLEPLGSHGSRCSAVDVQHAPMCEQSRVCAVYPSQPVSRALWSWAQTFVLVPRPADQVSIYASECWM